MNDSQIKCILAVAEHLNFTTAAKSIYLSQSVLSRQIASFEAETGITLFSRDKKEIRLTPAGEAVIAGLRRYTRELGNTLKEAQEIQLGTTGFLCLGVVGGQALSGSLSRALRSLLHKNSQIRLDLRNYTFSSLRAKLTSGSIDLAYLPKFEVLACPDVELRPIDNTPHYLAIHENHPLYNEVQSLEDLKGHSILVVEERDCRTLLGNIWDKLRDYGLDISMQEVESVDSKLLWIESGMAIGLVNERNVLCQFRNVRTILVPGADVGPEVLAWRRDNLNPAVQLLLQELEQQEEQ